MIYNHVLTVGTTGMLLAATQELFEQSKTLTCLARTSASLERLEPLATRGPDRLYTAAVDYRDETAFMGAAEQAWQRQPFDLAVLWIHSAGQKSLENLVSFLAKQPNRVSVFHVVSSVASEPDQKADLFNSGDAVSYHRIILGFQITPSGSRWLTHEEIGQGTLRAVNQPQAVCVIGTVRPWSLRP